MTDRLDLPATRPLRRALALVLTTAVLLLAAVMLVPTLLGYGRYVLVSGSMTGTYDTGSVVFTKNRPVADLRVGDVITYAPPAGSSPQELVTHRIASLEQRDGRSVLRTKGDANASVDPWTFTLQDREQAVVRVGVPYVGYAGAAFADRRVRMAVVGLPAVLVALFAVGGLLRDAAREAREEREGPSAGGAAGAADAGAGPEPSPAGAVEPHTVFPAHRRAHPTPL